MRYSAAEDKMWYKHGRTMLHPKDAFDDAIRNGMDEEGKYHYMYMYSSETMHFFKHFVPITQVFISNVLTKPVWNSILQQPVQ
jgi:hypothetical protein